MKKSLTIISCIAIVCFSWSLLCEIPTNLECFSLIYFVGIVVNLFLILWANND